MKLNHYAVAVARQHRRRQQAHPAAYDEPLWWRLLPYVAAGIIGAAVFYCFFLTLTAATTPVYR